MAVHTHGQANSPAMRFKRTACWASNTLAAAGATPIGSYRPETAASRDKGKPLGAQLRSGLA